MREIHDSTTSMAGKDFGPPGRLREQARPGDRRKAEYFWWHSRWLEESPVQSFVPD